MKKIFSTVILLLFFSFKSFAAPDGRGQIQLSEDVVKSFIDYLVGDIGTQKSVFNKPSTFWITIDGSRSYWWYNPQGADRDQRVIQTYSDSFQANEANTSGDAGNSMGEPTEERAKCERHHGQSCSRFAKGRYVSWNNGINPKGKAAKFSSEMNESEVRAKLTKLGFYNNDFLDTTTTPKITKKKETKKVVKKYSESGERSIAVSWDGYQDLIAGTVKFNEADYKGTLNLPLPNNDGTCDGTYSLQEGGKGTWQIACTNNMGAAGTLKWTENGGVSGSGRDHNDKKVKFTVSKKS